MKKRGIVALAIVAGVSAALAATVGTAGTARTAQPAKSCAAFNLRIGDVLPFTGGLAAYGANLDRAVKVAVNLDNAALKQDGLANRIKVTLVGSEDGQTQAAASVEAATKLVKSNKANVIIGEMASSATIPMAQSVTIPNHIVQISPTSSAPQISDIADNGYLWRTYPSDTLQGKVLAAAVVDAFGKGATVNVGARNDAFGTALKALFVAQYTKLGGKVGVNIAWNPDQANFDSEMGQLVGGNPKGWVIIDFPETFQKYVASLVRTGKWDASQTFMTEALRNTSVLDPIGNPVVGLRGTAASAAGGPAGASFAAYWKKTVTGREAVHRLRGHRPRCGQRRVPRGAAGVLVVAREDQGQPGLGLRAARRQGHLPADGEGDQAAPGGQAGRLRGRVQPGRLRQGRRHRLGGVRDLEVLGRRQDRHPEDRHLQGLMRRTYREGGGFEEAAAYSRAVRIGQHVAVSGTAAREGGDAYAQAREAIGRALAAADQLGAAKEDVLRTRLLLAPGCDWEGAVRAHAEAFAGVDPANTTYFVSGFIPDGVLVEFELDAVVLEPPR